MYYNPYLNQNTIYERDGRMGGFFVPFILGGLVGGAAVGVSRPRPIIANQYPPFPPRPPFNGMIPRPYY